MELQALFAVILLSLCISGAKSATFTFTNNCPYTIWPGALTGAGKPQLSTTGFQLNSTTSFSLDVPDGWSGRFWGRSKCSNDNVSGKFTCETGDCGSGEITCNGAGAIPPATLIELTLSSNIGDKDFYDASLVDGFNLPISLTPQQQQGGVASNCSSTSCTSNVNLMCPSELAVKGSDGSVIACKSACTAFNQPEYCCTGAFGNSQSCQPSKYSEFFKKECPQAYSYAYDDTSSTFTCVGRPNYLITFCP